MKNPQDPADPFDLDELVTWCVHEIARGVDYASYAIHFMQAADLLFPAPAEGNLRDDPDLRRRLALCMARMIWKEAPHPAHRYGPGPLPSSERNAPCHCGSGRKYKQCCQLIERGIPLEKMNLLPYLLDELPKQRWSELRGSRISLDMVAHTAEQWSEEGRDKDVLALLEPWFSDDTCFDARHELLFDLLLDVYTTLHKPRKKSTLLDRALAHGDRTLRSASMQRRVSMLADEGDYARAWALFADAQRSDPESPSLSHLEVTMLLSQGRDSEARDRARFWLLRFERRRDPDLVDLIGLLREIANEGSGALLRLAADNDPAVADFLEIMRAAPPVASHYALEASGDSAGPLRPSRTLTTALDAWSMAFPPMDYSPMRSGFDDDVWAWSDAWLPALRKHPILWNSFDALDALARAAAQIPVPGTEDLVDTLLDRGERVLREVIRINKADGLKLEWGWLENRPALSLLGARLTRELDAAPTPEHVARMEWLVRTLNPNDNQGFRTFLLRRYLELDRFDDALALADAYPDDFAAMRYGRALALFGQNKLIMATSVLREAVSDSPKLLAWLLKANPTEPRRSPYGIRVGGDDEAWWYRQHNLAQWQRLDALDWARRVAALSKR